MKKQVKKPTIKKVPLKQGKYAAVLKLRIKPDQIDYYDKLLTKFGVKNYTDAIFKAVLEMNRLNKLYNDTVTMYNKCAIDNRNLLTDIEILQDRFKEIKKLKDNFLKLIDTKF